MDLREFMWLLQGLGIYPHPISKTQTARIFKETNEGEDEAWEGVSGKDQDVHEMSFEEFKKAMIIIAQEFHIPIVYNGRDIAAKAQFNFV
eukprot:CAMPEP_0184315890 /NCGR_PEP_ID=MMETSP1049-20130417/86476_1 /TAXON_ID=77928 /ORGANISM="Proteomonas sulcata, Strain CCMP704" /LENGTH=89 /DNA_ID=CAMNT_0026634619 /DNA_START=92 /DNA_END=361 /DNA_ORIENTATION=+